VARRAKEPHLGEHLSATCTGRLSHSSMDDVFSLC
jgi:hypothetical protein